MPSVIISVSHRKQFVLPRKNTGTPPRKDELIAELANLIQALRGGALNADSLSVSIGTSSAPATRAAGLVQFSASSGAVGATINGVAVTVTWATSDTASMTAFTAAVRASANALVKGLVSAVNRRLQITAGVVTAGEQFALCGITFTAVSGAPSGPQAAYQFDISSGVAATIATNIATMLNAAPGIGERFRAVSSGTAVHIFLMEDRAGTSAEMLRIVSGALITLTQPTVVQDNIGCIFALNPGVQGNANSVAASGTGVTFVTVNAGRLGAGSGGDTATVHDIAPF